MKTGKGSSFTHSLEDLKCDKSGDANNKTSHVQDKTAFVHPTLNAFIELMLINRILFTFKKWYQSKTKIDNSFITTHLSQFDKNKQQSCAEILLLLRKHDIGKYISTYYEDSQCNMIDLIFNHVILKHHTDKYKTQITMKQRNTNNTNKNGSILTKKYQCLLFNQQDLIPQIFQYLTLKQLSNCSKVNFIWLVHSFNVNSLYCLRVHNICRRSEKLSFRVWQRLINVRDIICHFGFEKDCNFYLTVFDKDFFNKIKLFQNIESVDCAFVKPSLDDMKILDIIASNYNKIKSFTLGHFNNWDKHSQCYFYHFARTGLIEPGSGIPPKSSKQLPVEFELLPVFKLPNAEKIKLTGIEACIIVSNKCQELYYSQLTINEKMFLSLINDCDLTGVKTICLDEINWPWSKSLHSNSKKNMYDKLKIKECCDKLANALPNVEKIRIGGYTNRDTLNVCKSIQSKIGKNKCHVQVSLVIDYDECIGADTYGFVLDQIFEEQRNMITFIKNENVNVIDIEIGSGEKSLDIAKLLFKTSKICQNVEILRAGWQELNKHSKKDEFFNFMYNINDRMDNDNGYGNVDVYTPDLSLFGSEWAVSNIYKQMVDKKYTKKLIDFFPNLECFVGKFDKNCYEPSWQLFSHFLDYNADTCNVSSNSTSTMTMNSNYKNDDCCNSDIDDINDKKSNIDSIDDKALLWKIEINDHISDEAKLFECVNDLKKLWTVVNNKYILARKPIDLTIEMSSLFSKIGWYFRQSDYHYREQPEEPEPQPLELKKIYQNTFKPAFIQVFGDVAFDFDQSIQSNDIKYNYNVIEVGNKYCQVLKVPRIWCRYTKQDFGDLMLEQRMHFVVCNVKYKGSDFLGLH